MAILKSPDAIETLVQVRIRGESAVNKTAFGRKCSHHNFFLQELLPSRLCDYTYNLCVAFNEFYGSCKVIGSEEEKARLFLCQATALSLRQSFHILGIQPLYRL